MPTDGALNCWDFKKCGRTDCPARVRNAGCLCWIVAGTMCGGSVQGTFAQKIGSCLECDFYKFRSVVAASRKGMAPQPVASKQP